MFQEAPPPSGGGVGFVAAAVDSEQKQRHRSSVRLSAALLWDAFGSTSLHALQFFAESVQSVFDDVQLVPDVLHHAVDIVGVL